MKIKRYTGETMQDAIFKVKAELGSDAVILHTRTIKTGGFLGFFGRKITEIMAAAPEKEKKKKDDGGNREIQEMKEMLNSLVKRMPQGLNGDGLIPLEDRYAPPLRPFVSTFYEQGVKTEIIKEIMDIVSKEWQESPTIDTFPVLLKKAFSILFKDVEMERKLGRVQAFIGPTGVGKTTTIAKLAANYVLLENKRVALLTTDTYRIAAVEQLKIYSEIIDIPLEILYKPQEMEPIIDSLEDCDYILMDTAGLSPLDQIAISNLQAFITNPFIDNTFLVLSATTRYQDLEDIIKIFQKIGYSDCIFTKMDETDAWGSLINTIYTTHCWITYITTGQDVPEDIEELRLMTLVQNFTKGLDLYGSGNKATSYRR